LFVALPAKLDSDRVNAPAPILPASPAAIADAAEHLRCGRLVAFPTETVYGLGADATNERAVAAVFAAKGRPHFNPLIVHVGDLATAEALAVFDDRARRLAQCFWPGPLTLVLRRREGSKIALLVSAGLETIALRVPDHPLAQALLATAALPIAAPSANPSGHVSPTTAAHVAETLGQKVAMILDGGPCRIGIESTVIDLTQATAVLLRPGGLAGEVLEPVAGPLASPTDGKIRSPGMSRRHYAPHRPLRLNAHEALAGEALLGFGPDARGAVMNLSPTGDVIEAAANLFAMVRALDRMAVTGIAVMPIPEVGLGRAINDRLRRAAVPGETDPWEEDRGPAAPCMLPGGMDEE
jgi:L-threonylcarbamoyladenylate synthase